MSELTEPQLRALKEIEAGNQDDCTVMLPAGMVCLERGPDGNINFPPKIILTESWPGGTSRCLR